MSKKGEEAKNNFIEGYNCAQAVLVAFSRELGMEKETLARLASSFGGGFGRLREVCGAFTAACMVAGLKRGYSDPLAKEEKAEHYKLIQEMAAEFKAKNGSIICRELIGEEAGSYVPEARTEKYYQTRPCADLVASGAELAEKLLV
jgi:C_GCAxxG_C_C family probable redox protein